MHSCKKKKKCMWRHSVLPIETFNLFFLFSIFFHCGAVGPPYSCCSISPSWILLTRERAAAEDGGASLSAFRNGWRWLSPRRGCRGSFLHSDRPAARFFPGNNNNNSSPGGRFGAEPSLRISRVLTGHSVIFKSCSGQQERRGRGVLSLTVCVWLGSAGGCACMCSAPYGRRRRPRSAGIIFPSRVAQTEPERRDSTEGAVDGSRMVSSCQTEKVLCGNEAWRGLHQRMGARFLFLTKQPISSRTGAAVALKATQTERSAGI